MGATLGRDTTFGYGLVDADANRDLVVCENELAGCRELDLVFL